MKIYDFMCRIGFPKGYLAKILLVSFLGVHIPMIGAVVYVLLAVNISFHESLGILAALLAATLIGTIATMLVHASLMAPISMAANALRTYLATGTVPALPTGYTDRAGNLLSNVQEAVTRLDIALDLARTQRDEALQSKREKFEVLAGMSHDLRTPLHQVIGFAELMSSEALGPMGESTYRGYAGDIEASGKDLLRTLQVILDLSSVEAGKLQLNLEKVSVGNALDKAVNLVHHRAQSNGIQFTVDQDMNTTLAVMTDERTLKQILLHMFEVAMAEPTSTTRVFVSAADSTGEVRIHVENDRDWNENDLPSELRKSGKLESFGQVVKIEKDSGIKYSTPTTLRLSLIMSLGHLVGGTLLVGTSVNGGRWLAIELPKDGQKIGRPMASGKVESETVA